MSKRYTYSIYSALLILLACQAQTSKSSDDVLNGKVTYVTDGDTFHMVVDGEKIKIRLADIDCPEKNQPYGLEAKAFLMSLIKDKEVEVRVKDTDRYGRKVGYVYYQEEDINLKLIQNGFAWWYKKYGPNNTAYQEAEWKARSEKVGLWSNDDQVEPWVWRNKTI